MCVERTPYETAADRLARYVAELNGHLDHKIAYACDPPQVLPSELKLAKMRLWAARKALIEALLALPERSITVGRWRCEIDAAGGVDIEETNEGRRLGGSKVRQRPVGKRLHNRPKRRAS